MNRPKFCVGEEVMIRCNDFPERNVDKTEVVRAEYDNYRDVITGKEAVEWCYKTESDIDERDWWDETALRKLPPEDRTSWDNCIFNPLKEKA